MEEYLAGELEIEIRLVREPSGGIGMDWNDNVIDDLPVDARAIYEDYLARIMDGEIDVPGEREGWD